MDRAPEGIRAIIFDTPKASKENERRRRERETRKGIDFLGSMFMVIESLLILLTRGYLVSLIREEAGLEILVSLILLTITKLKN